MKLKVTFREYDLPDVDPETGEEERGDFIQSFSEVIEGKTSAKILIIAGNQAEKYSQKFGTDVRVWQTEVTITPRGIISL